jgi:hypothetical protein
VEPHDIRITHIKFLHETSTKRLLLLSKLCYPALPSELCRHIFIPALHPPLILPRCILYIQVCVYMHLQSCIFGLFPLPPPLMPLTPACKITDENKSQVLLFVTSPFWDLFLNILRNAIGGGWKNFVLKLEGVDSPVVIRLCRSEYILHNDNDLKIGIV